MTARDAPRPSGRTEGRTEGGGDRLVSKHTPGRYPKPVRFPRQDNGEPLGDRLRRLAVWADNTPQHARQQIAIRIDALAVLLGQLVADDEEPG